MKVVIDVEVTIKKREVLLIESDIKLKDRPKWSAVKGTNVSICCWEVPYWKRKDVANRPMEKILHKIFLLWERWEEGEKR